MIVYECEGGSLEWMQHRAGKITASNFWLTRDKLKTGKHKGEYSAAARQYAFKLALERIGGKALLEDGFSPWQAERGQNLERVARDLHEREKGIFVELAGFVSSDCGHFGASVDGFIDDYGIVEYKCFLSTAKLEPILIDGDIGKVKDQVQGGLLITERDYAEFVLYCPILESANRHLTIIELARDDEYIEQMRESLEEFNQFVEARREALLASNPSHKKALAHG